MPNNYAFGANSERVLSTIDDDLARVFRRALSFGVIDFSVVDGARSEERQAVYVRNGFSQTLESKHVVTEDGEKARAGDVLPWPAFVNGRSAWNDRDRLCRLAGVIQAAAALEGVPIRWGGDWDGDGNNLDSDFDDLYHFEKVGT